MGQAISEVLPFAVGVAISPVPIIAVILMLFSDRSRVNGPVFLLGWVLGLAVVAGVGYGLSDGADAATSDSAQTSIAWGKVVLGVLLLAGARRRWRNRPAPGAEPPMPKWMAGVEGVAPVKALGLGVALSAVNPKNLILTLGAAAGVAQAGVSTGDAVAGLAVFVVLASLTIAGPVLYRLVGGEGARTTLDELKAWLSEHNDAVMAALLLVFGAVLISKGLPPLTD
jgi:hypothetical protein